MPHDPELHCSTCPLRPSGIFRQVPRELLPLLDAGTVSHALPAGHQLFEEGSPPLAVHCIRRGSVKVYKLGPGGEEQILRILGRGEVVGFRAVLAGEPFGATAETLEETAVCTVPAQTMIALIRRSPDFAVDVLAKVARELRISEDALVDIQRKTVRQRLAAILLMLADRKSPGPKRTNPGAVRLSRRDLARLIATTPESISRALRRLAAERSVECSRAEIRLRDLAALRRAAGGDPLPELDHRQVAW